MKSKIILQEKLWDLRKERNLTLSDVSKATGLSLSTLQRLESDDDVNTGSRCPETDGNRCPLVAEDSDQQ